MTKLDLFVNPRKELIHDSKENTFLRNFGFRFVSSGKLFYHAYFQHKERV